MKQKFPGGRFFWIGAAALLALLCALGLSARTGGGTMTGEERRIAEILSAITGAGKVEVALYAVPSSEGLGNAAKYTGAVVVSEGADRMEVRLDLIRAVRTLLGLPESAVDVFLMEAGR